MKKEAFKTECLFNTLVEKVYRTQSFQKATGKHTHSENKSIVEPPIEPLLTYTVIARIIHFVSRVSMYSVYTELKKIFNQFKQTDQKLQFL